MKIYMESEVLFLYILFIILAAVLLTSIVTNNENMRSLRSMIASNSGPKTEDTKAILSHYYINDTLQREYYKKHYDLIDWSYISTNVKLHSVTIHNLSQYLNWHYMSKYQVLDESIIDKYSDKVFWVWISSNQYLTEKILFKYHDKVYWKLIVRYQTLNDHIIREVIKMGYIDKCNLWNDLLTYQTISEKLLDEYKIQFYNMRGPII